MTLQRLRRTDPYLVLPILAIGLALAPSSPLHAQPPKASAPETVRWFQDAEQSLMDAVAPGHKEPWERLTDPNLVVTSEEGEILGRKELIGSLGGLPPGLSGDIRVKELTVQEYPAFAIVRYLADESETVFGQKLHVLYRVTDTFRREGSARAKGSPWKMVASHTSVVTTDPPAQTVDKSNWPKYAGAYRLLPDGWTFIVELRDGTLYGGRDPKKLKPLVPLAPDAFVVSGSLGEWIFVADPKGDGTPSHLYNLRKFAPLVWTRVPVPATPAGDP